MTTDDDQLVDDALGTLRNSPAPRNPGSPGWPSPDNIRRRGLRFRRRRRIARTGTALVLAAAVAITVPLVVTHHGATNHTAGSRAVSPSAANPSLHVIARSGNAVEEAAFTAAASSNPLAETVVANAEQQFTLQLLRQLNAAGAGTNLVISPASLSIALSMLNLGARGATQQQIAKLLGPVGTSATQLASGWASMVSDWTTAAAPQGIAFTSVDSLWLQQGAALVPSFMTDLARYFSSGVWSVDFAEHPQQAVADLNAWVKTETHGKITNLLTARDVQGLLLVLVNAVYLDAPWATPFNAPTSSPTLAPFTTSTGAVVKVPTMTGTFTVPVSKTPNLTVAQLPYRGGRFAALLIEPATTSLNQFVNALTPAQLDAIVAGMQRTESTVLLPKLSLVSSTSLKPALQALGMTDAFKPAGADLSGISTQPSFVSFVKQQATLDVAEDGTTAAAVTAIGVGPQIVATHEPPAIVAFNRPFLFLVRDTQTGAVLFAAEVTDPRT